MIQLYALGPILEQIYTRDSLEFTTKLTLDGRNGYRGSLIFAPKSCILFDMGPSACNWIIGTQESNENAHRTVWEGFHSALEKACS